MSVPAGAAARRRPGVSRMRLRQIRDGYLCILPWLVGFIVFTAGPITASLGLSFTRYDVLDPPRFVGLSNYRKLFTDDPLFGQSLKVTLLYTIALVPLRTVGGYFLALLLNQLLRGIGFFRTLFYLPSVVPAVATAYLFAWMFQPDLGLINTVLGRFGILGPNWFGSREWVIPGFILMGSWSLGGTMILYLAALQGVPTALYEAAMLDGAGWWGKFWHVTIPMTSPVIFFTFLTGMIGTFQVFSGAYIITRGGPADASLFYVLNLYRHAWRYLRMGYASALAWILFLIILILTIIVLRLSSRHVYYESVAR